LTVAGGKGLSIGKLSELSGFPVETIRYYERSGVLHRPPRTKGGRRSYCDAQIRQLLFIRRARDLGFSLERVKQLLALAENQPADCRRVRAIAAAHVSEVRARIAEFKRIVGQLDLLLRLEDDDRILLARRGEPSRATRIVSRRPDPSKR
jgi:MerR family transcriptional regulator, mercuric resistance operon regulatory protein